MRHRKIRYAAVLAAAGAMAMPGAAFGQGLLEPTDDPLYNETTAPFLENTVFHTDGGADYRSDGGTGAETDSDYHSDDSTQSATLHETLLANAVVSYETTYDQIDDTSVNILSARSDNGATTINYTRDREKNNFSVSVTIGGETTFLESPTLLVPTGYQIYAMVTG